MSTCMPMFIRAKYPAAREILLDHSSENQFGFNASSKHGGHPTTYLRHNPHFFTRERWMTVNQDFHLTS